MQSDRELLEMAAKAAGITIDPIDAAHEPDDWMCWNPLTDDGDALRLAVRLRLVVSNGVFITDGAHVQSDTMPGIVVVQPNDDDPYAATRRAIVRAAAEIGKRDSKEGAA